VVDAGTLRKARARRRVPLQRHAAPLLFDHAGAHLFVWATDYPHPDHPSTWVEALTRQVDRLSESTRAGYLGGNVRRIYRLL
jgi:predicted TIM-barrel fold metal-dependent hydrolase